YRGDVLPLTPASVRTARLLATAALADWGLWPWDDLVTCVSELVSNAVEHTMPPAAGVDRRVSVGLRLWHGSKLFVEVGDDDPQLIYPAPALGPGRRAPAATAWWIVPSTPERTA